MKKFTLFALLLLVGSTMLYGQSWNLTGNSNATSSSKLGTTNSVPLRLFTKNSERLRIDTIGRVGIGTALPNASALLDLSSTARGFLVPRMSTAQRNAIPSPARGLLIFQTDGTPGFYYYNGGWQALTPNVSGFANRSLSNLTSPTAVNQTLLPNATNTRDLGSASLAWKDLYLRGYVYLDGTRFLSNAPGTGTNNAFVGSNAGLSITSGINNTALGQQALGRNTSGSNNTATGSFSMFSNSLATDNTAYGPYTLYTNTNGYYNIAIGPNALYNNANGSYNVGIGNYALYSNTSGNFNVGVGYQALITNSTGVRNIAMGYAALVSNSTGTDNTAIGYAALNNNGSGIDNTIMGSNSGINLTGSYNTGVGWSSLHDNTNSYQNAALGISSGYGYATNGTFLGAFAQGTFSGITNATAIGYLALVDASNKVRIGNNQVTSIGGQVGWSSFSDGRFKKNVQENVPGLEFINQLRPVTYNVDINELDKATKAILMKAGTGTSNNPKIVRNNGETPQADASSSGDHKIANLPDEKLASIDRQGMDAQSGISYTGFIAQEVEQSAKKLGYDFSGVDKPKSENGFYGLRYGEFVVPLVKAVQELSKKADRADSLQNRVNQLEARLAKLEALIKGNSTTSTSLSNTILEQNAPNPFDHSTSIKYAIPSGFQSAQLVITDNAGRTIKAIPLTSDSGVVNVDGSLLSSGSYHYSLLVDGKVAQTKKMLITK